MTDAATTAPDASVAARLDWDVVSSQEEIEAAVSAGFDVSRDWPIRARICQPTSGPCRA